MRTVLSWLFCAARRYCAPDSTCSAHSRRKRTANTTIASIPSTPIRSASRGVKRYGSATLGSGGRKRERTRLAKELHLTRPLAPLRPAQDASDERVDGPRQEDVQDHRRREAVEQDEPRRRRLPEHEVEHQPADLVQRGDHRDGEQRRVRAVAA